MTAGEQGFLLLTGYLGDPERNPLTIPQFRLLTQRVRAMEKPKEDRALSQADLVRLGYDRPFADRILFLLSHTEQLQWYLDAGKRRDCYPITRASRGYPSCLRERLGLDAPGALWVKGDISLLDRPAVALVGSRDLSEENRKFAEKLGAEAARQGFVLISGHARGADRTAQESCLEQGGKVISVVADRLEKYPLQNNVLYLSEEGYDLAFSTQRALQRNRIIHSLGSKTFVAQCTLGKGGTWDGTRKNLLAGWTPVFCFRDGSQASVELQQLGAVLVDKSQLSGIALLQPIEQSFI